MTANIAFSGAHSTGKTTVLQAIKARNINGVFVDDVSVSRQAQEEMGLALPDIVKDRVLMQRFQELLLQKKAQRLIDLSDQGYDIIFTDRSPADMYAYTFLWDEKFQDHEWFETYETSTLKAMVSYKAIINFPVIPEIPFVGEPGRAELETRERHGRLVSGYLNVVKYAPEVPCAPFIHQLASVSTEFRVDEILDYVKLKLHIALPEITIN